MTDRLNPAKAAILAHVERVLAQQIVPHFNEQAKVSLLVRVPGKPNATIVMTYETPDQYAEAIEAMHNGLTNLGENSRLVRGG